MIFLSILRFGFFLFRVFSFGSVTFPIRCHRGVIPWSEQSKVSMANIQFHYSHSICQLLAHCRSQVFERSSHFSMSMWGHRHLVHSIYLFYLVSNKSTSHIRLLLLHWRQLPSSTHIHTIILYSYNNKYPYIWFWFMHLHTVAYDISIWFLLQLCFQRDFSNLLELILMYHSKWNASLFFPFTRLTFVVIAEAQFTT